MGRDLGEDSNNHNDGDEDEDLGREGENGKKEEDRAEG